MHFFPNKLFDSTFLTDNLGGRLNSRDVRNKDLAARFKSG